MDFQDSFKFFQNNNSIKNQENLTFKDIQDNLEYSEQQKIQKNSETIISFKISNENLVQLIQDKENQPNEININKNSNQINQNQENIMSIDSNKEKYISNSNEEINEEKNCQNNYSQSSQIQYEKTFFKNKNTTVIYQYKSNKNKITVRKRSNLILNESQKNEFFENECQILKKLKGHNITLDISKIDTKSQSFEQTLGKTDLYCLNKNIQDRHIFEVYFLVLLDKLNKMHDLGIAHSDIKPQNIVISFHNEPFFIDFDCSVFLSQCENYLINFTYRYNLAVYFNKEINKKKPKYVSKKFKDKEEIKICDRTQLALTFLYLLCENKSQKKLFVNKLFNELIIELYNNNSNNIKNNNNINHNFQAYAGKYAQSSKIKNREIVLSLISRILNQADQTIQIIGEYQQGSFIIHHGFIHHQLAHMNNVRFDKRKNIYFVNRIDKYSIKLIYLLNKMGSEIVIIPSQMIIIPEPEEHEYQYVCQQYQQIEEYFEQFLNGFPVIRQNDMINICKYLKKLKNKKCTFYIESINFLELLFKSLSKSKYIDTLELNFIFKPKFLESFMTHQRTQLPEYDIKQIFFQQDDKEKFLYNQNCNMVKCLLSRISSEPNIKNIELQIYSIEKIEEIVNLFFNDTQNQQQINQLKIIWQYCYYNVFKNENKQYKELQYLIKLIENTNISLQIKQEILFEQDHSQKLQQYLEILQNRDKNEKFQNYQKAIKYHCVNELVQNLKQNSKFSIQTDDFNCQSEGFNSQLDNQIIFNIRKLECEKGENIVINVLDCIRKINQSYKLILKFFNFFFLDLRIWQDIIQIIEYKVNIQIQIELVNCEFCNDIFNLLQNIYLKSNQVEFKFHDEFQQEEEDNKLIYKFNILNDENLNETRLNILYYRKFANQNELSYKNQKQQQQIQTQRQIQQQKYDRKQNEQSQDMLNDQKAIKNFLEKSINQNIKIKELKVPDEQQSNALRIKQDLVDAVKVIKKEEDLQSVIEKAKNNCFYKSLRIKINSNKFEQLYQKLIKIEYQWDINSIDILEKFQYLLVQIINRFQEYGVLIFIIIRKYQLFTIEFVLKSYLRYGKLDKKPYYPYFDNSNQDIPKSDNTNFIPNQIVSDDVKFKIIKMDKEIFNDTQLTFNLHILKEWKFEQSDDDTSEQVLKQQIKCLYNTFQEQQNLIKQEMKIFEITDYIKINDKQFMLFLNGTEEIFQKQQNKYTVFQCGLTKQTLYDIYEKKNIQQDKQYEFDFGKNQISLLDLEQFIYQIIKDQSPKRFIFQIKISNPAIKKIIKIQFKNQLSYQNISGDEYFILEYQPQNQLQKQNDKILMIFQFQQQYLYDFLENKINKKLYDSGKNVMCFSEFIEDLFKNSDSKRRLGEKKLKDKKKQ